MSLNLSRAVATRLCDVIRWLEAGSARAWGAAIRRELDAIDDDGEALSFAVQAFIGMLPIALKARLFGSLLERVRRLTLLLTRPRPLAIACGAGAVLLGLAFMLAADAPRSYGLANLSALIAAVALCRASGVPVPFGRRDPATVALLLAALLFGSTVLGTTVDGITRWVHLGPLAVQPSLILLPALLVTYSYRATATSTAAVLIAVVALAMQPDSAMLGVTALCTGFVAVARKRLATAGVTAAACAALLHTSSLPARLEPAPFVDDVLYAAFEAHLLLGVAVSVGCGLLLLPAIVGWMRGRLGRTTYLAFAVTWAGIVLAATLTDGPTPLVGYGGSAIIGYFLSIVTLPEAYGPANEDSIATRSDSPVMREAPWRRSWPV